MRRLLTASIILSLLPSAWLVAVPHPGQARRVRLADLMTKAEYDRAGLSKLSDAEREALEEWLTRYSERLGASAAGRSGRAPEPPELEGLDRGEICDTDRLPRGWIKVGDRWSPSKCGSPATIEYNVWEVERYTNKPVGAEMEVCAEMPTPPGWEQVGARWNPTTCGRPSGVVDNVKRIRRVR